MNTINNIEYYTEIKKNHPHFNGHFKHYPVFPGVSQINLIKKFLIFHLNYEKLKIKSIEKCKFTNIIKPNTKVILNLNLINDNNNSTKKECHWTIKSINGEIHQFDV